MGMSDDRFLKIISDYINDVDYSKFNKKAGKTLKIDKQLPQIILPENKLQMFIDWWNTDIRYEKSVPHSFNSGYLILQNIIPQISEEEIQEKYNDMIKATAKAMHLTYTAVKNQLFEFNKTAKDITMYFTFLDENKLYAETYDTQNRIISNITAEIGDNKENNIIELGDIYNSNSVSNFDKYLDIINMHSLGLLITSLWYIATTTSTTKYIYEKTTPVITSRHRNVVNVSSTKTISTPIYDMKKIKVVKIDSLVARKKGWTYSHSFQVHGHYRHYKNGKTIFIQPFIKGKDKEFKAQAITLNPKE